MSKPFFRLLLLLSIVSVHAQEGAFSPYSFYGTGTTSFQGTVENRSMGGISLMSDSIHLNLNNPAAYADLDYTAFTGGMSYNSITIEERITDNNTIQDNNNITTVDYFAIGIPLENMSFGFGLKPFSSVGYTIIESTEEGQRNFEGRGGLNDVFLSAGYKVTDQLNVGATASYIFGDIENRTLIFQPLIQFASREFNNSDFKGVNVNFGAQYDYKLNEKYELTASLSYRPEFNMNVENTRNLAVVTFQNDGSEVVVNEQSSGLIKEDITLPSRLSMGLAIGEERVWGAGIEYVYKSASDFSDMPFNARDNVSYNATSSFKLGGYYVPRFNDPQKYYNRINYRFGLRYEELDLNIGGEQLEEFGISFGVGLPAGRIFTNANLGVEYGMRGKVSDNLVKEEFVSLFLSFSFNDLWFQDRKYN